MVLHALLLFGLPRPAPAQEYTRWDLPGDGDIQDLASSPDGTSLAVASNIGIWLYDTHTRSEVLLETGWVPGGGPHLALTPGGTMLASATWAGPIRLWDVERRALVGVMDDGGDTTRVSALAFSPDGEMLASGRTDKSIHIWDVGARALLHTLEGHTGWVTEVAFSPDGTTLAGSDAGGSLYLWEAHTGQLLGTLERHEYGAAAVAFSPGGGILASGSGDGLIRLWDMGTHQLKTVLEGHWGTVRAIAFSPDGTTLASGAWDSRIRLWDVASGEALSSLDAYGTNNVWSLAFDPPGGNPRLRAGLRPLRSHALDLGRRHRTASAPIVAIARRGGSGPFDGLSPRRNLAHGISRRFEDPAVGRRHRRDQVDTWGVQLHHCGLLP